MQIRFYVPVLAAIIILAAGCSKKNKEGLFVPEDAAIAVHINGASISTKLPWEEVKNTDLFKELSNDTSLSSFAKQALENPDNSGIDTKNGMVFFVKRDSTGGYVSFSGTIKDAEKFRLFNIDVANGGVQSEDGGINFLSKYPVCVAWNKEKFVYVSNVDELNAANYSRNMFDSSVTYKSTGRDMIKTCKDVFNLKEDKSLATNEKFTELVKKTGDLHFWMNSEELNKGALQEAGLKMLNIDIEKLYKGSITTATVNFENGKILFDTKSYASKEVAAIWEKYGGKTDENLLKRLPAKDVAFVLAINFKPEGIKELVKLMGIEAYANMGLAFVGFTLDDFIKANKGDVLLAISDFEKTTDTAPKEIFAQAGSMFNKPDILFATSIGDKDAFNKLVKAGEKQGKKMMQSDSLPIALNSNGSYFAIGSKKTSVDKFIEGGNSSFDFVSKITGQSVGGYVNIQYILKAFGREAAKDSSAKAAYDASLAFWDNAYMKGGDFSNGGMTSIFEINLLDKNTNSLKQLNQYLGKLGAIAKKEKEKRDKEMELEAKTLYPPPPPPADASKK